MNWSRDLNTSTTNLQTGKENQTWNNKQTLKQLQFNEAEEKSWWVRNRGSAFASLGLSYFGPGAITSFAVEQAMIEWLGMDYNKESTFTDKTDDMKEKLSEITGSLVVK